VSELRRFQNARCKNKNFELVFLSKYAPPLPKITYKINYSFHLTSFTPDYLTWLGFHLVHSNCN